MQTQRLYYDAPELETCEARALRSFDADGVHTLVLDRSIFYPEGGGQPADRGWVDGIAVLDAVEAGDEIHVHLERPFEGAPRTVECRLDAARRLDHAQQHSAQHLLSATTLRLLGGPTVSFHLGEAYCSIDVDLKDIEDDEAAALEAAVNEAIREAYPIIIHRCPPERIEDFPLRKRPPEGEAELRVVEIDGLDYSPCCGTHLSNTARIRAFRLLRAEKYKGMTRVAFLAGERAFADYRRLAALARRTASSLACAEDEAPGRAAALLARVGALEAEAASLVRERAKAEAGLAFRERTEDVPIFRYAERPLAQVLETAKVLAARLERPVLAFCAAELKVTAASATAESKLGERLKPLIAEAGGKGGGGPTLVQAAFAHPEDAERFMQAAASALARRG